MSARHVVHAVTCLYLVVSCNCEPVDVALYKPISANVTCGHLGPELFLSHRFVFVSTSVRESNMETCSDEDAYPPSAMVDGSDSTWWQSSSRRNIISVLGDSADFDAEIYIDLQQACMLILSLKSS